MSTVDFGDIPVGREETRTIEIKNVGGSPLLIKRVVATCGCTQVRVDRDVLPPGESSRLTISVREVRPLNGKQSVSIVSSDADQPVVTVQVLYSVKPSGLSFAPPFLDFGRAGIDNLPATTSCRTWIGASDAGRMRVATTDAWLAASLELTSAGHVDLVACLQTNAPYGPVDSFVICRDPCTGDEARIPVRGYVRGEFFCDPPAVLLARATDGHADIATIEIRSRHDPAEAQIRSFDVSSSLRGNILVTPSSERGPAKISVATCDSRGIAGVSARRLSGRLLVSCLEVGTDHAFVLAIPVEVLAW